MKYTSQFSTFERLIQNIEPHIANSGQFSASDAKDILTVLKKVHLLLEDIGIDPDRKYAVAEVQRLARAIKEVL